MATYTYREVTTKRCEWIVPAAEPWGACYTEVSKAFAAARNALIDAGVIEEGEYAKDDQIRVRAGDEEIIVSIEAKIASAAGER